MNDLLMFSKDIQNGWLGNKFFERSSKKKQKILANVNSDRVISQNTFQFDMQILTIWRDGRFSSNLGSPFGNPAHAILLRKRSANLHLKN